MSSVIEVMEKYDADYYKKNKSHIIRFIEKRLKTPESIYGKIVRKKKHTTFETIEDAWSSLDSILVYKKNEKISREVKDNIERYAKWSRRMDKMVHQMMKTSQ